MSTLIRGEVSKVVENNEKGFLDQTERQGVLFITQNTITEPFEDEENIEGKDAPTQYGVYKAAFEALQDETSIHYRQDEANLSPDSQ